MSTVTSRKIAERLVLAREIESYGHEMFPCSRCAKQNRKYVVDTEKSTRCAECVRSKQSCDVKKDAWTANVPSTGDWESIAKQKERLEEEEEEAMAKILRLRKQRKLLLRREAEMAKRGLRFLDELDAAEEKEHLAAEAENTLLASPSTSAHDHTIPERDPFPGVDPSAFSPSNWGFWGADASTPEASHG
jgi:hypothetical protein